MGTPWFLLLQNRDTFCNLRFWMPLVTSGFGWFMHFSKGLVLKGDFQVSPDKFSCSVLIIHRINKNWGLTAENLRERLLQSEIIF